MGAPALAPGNTLASFDAALRHGVDMIELDVISERADGGGRLLVAHERGAPREPSPLTFEQALGHLTSGSFAAVELMIDVKLPGYERRVLEGLREFGVGERALLSGMTRAGRELVRAARAPVRVGWTVPSLRAGFANDALAAVPGLARCSGYRVLLARRARAALSASACDAIVANWRVVSPLLVRAVAQAGGELYAWTVDDRRAIERLRAIGVGAIVTNDPRLF